MRTSLWWWLAEAVEVVVEAVVAAGGSGGVIEASGIFSFCFTGVISLSSFAL